MGHVAKVEGIIATGTIGVDVNPQQFDRPDPEPGFFLNLPDGRGLGMLTRFQKTAGNIPPAQIGFDAPFDQQQPALTHY